VLAILGVSAAIYPVAVRTSTVWIEIPLTLLAALTKMGVKVPTLCHSDSVSPYAACRLCLVESRRGERTTCREGF